MTFEELGLNKNILKKIDALGWENPTPIQQKVIPVAKSGQDIVGIAQTGTGKTGAFLLPIISKLGYQHQPDPRVLIFAPSKELAQQIGNHFSELNVANDLNHTVLVGGISITDQIKKIEAGTDVLVCTPGRFMDIYKKGILNLNKISTLVLDEADRLMDMGFMRQLRTILEVIPVKRQNMLFSATYPENVEELSYEFLEYPTKIEIKAESTPADTVAQFYYPVTGFQNKVQLLEHLLEDEEKFSRIIIFVNKKESADKIFRFASRKLQGGAVVIHSNKSQSNRSNSISQFESGEKRILVTTNVSSRGLDINEVSHVINFDLPKVFEDYVHRIGRTGRAFKVGEAITFTNKGEILFLERFISKHKLSIEKINFPDSIDKIQPSKEEIIEMERDIDYMKRKADPTYKGAFHEKKAKNNHVLLQRTSKRYSKSKKGKRR